MIGSSRFILCVYCSRSGIGHFSNKSWYLIVPSKTLICHPASLKIVLFQGSRDSAFRVRRPGVSVACREGEVEDTVASESSTLMGCCWGPDDG